MSRGYGIVFIVHSYLHLLCSFLNGGKDGFMPFSKAVEWSETQTALSSIWTRITNVNCYIKCIFVVLKKYDKKTQWKVIEKTARVFLSEWMIITITIIIIGNDARNLDLIILPDGTCTNQNPSWRIRCKKFSGVLRKKQIT